MLRKILILTLFFSIHTIVSAQNREMRLKLITARFEAFAYKDVILIADSISLERSIYSTQELSEVFRMKAIAQFSVWDEEAAAGSFRELLRINRNYKLDEKKTSPKILALFNKTKLEFLAEQVVEEKSIPKDTIRIFTPAIRDTLRILVKEPDYNFLRSVVFPGWGHVARNIDTKGMVITGVAAAAALSTIYFTYDCNKKQNDYLNETSRSQVGEKYDAYNTSYKARNISLILYGCVWAFAQIDYLGWNPLFLQSGNQQTMRWSLLSDTQSLISFSYSF